MGKAGRHSFGIIGGLGALASADVFFKLAKASRVGSGSTQDHILLEQHAFSEPAKPGAVSSNQTARKLYVFDMIRAFQQCRVDAVLLPCFISQTFIKELTAEMTVPVIDLMRAMQEHVRRHYPSVKRLGVLTSDYVIRDGLFERSFDPAEYALIYPHPDVQADCLMLAIYGPHGIKSGGLKGESIPLLLRACQDLAEQGAELILLGFSEIPIVIDSLVGCPVPIVDCNQVYAQHAIDFGNDPVEKTYKVGIVGGVGPAATVDFLDKIIRNTPAYCDQEHIKLVVEQNPQIPDRTANLLAGGTDPTIALYATCKRLEADDADMIAIPCNTAHAFVERIQPYLGIPIIHMLYETIQHIQQHPSGHKTVGLLATDGTINSRVYHKAAAKVGIQLVVPDEVPQRSVMAAIYGPWGVKAGYIEGQCRKDLQVAIEHLVRDKGAEILILGCTELPLLVVQSDHFPVLGKHIAVLDPTEILARKCVQLAQQRAGGPQKVVAGCEGREGAHPGQKTVHARVEGRGSNHE